MTRQTVAARASVAGMVALLTAAGVTHFTHPRPYVEIVPRALPAPDALVAISGVAELLIAGGLAIPRTRRAAAWAAIVLFVVVFPGNIQHALDAEPGTAEGWLTKARLPLQPVLIWWAYRIAKRATTERLQLGSRHR